VLVRNYKYGRINFNDDKSLFYFSTTSRDWVNTSKESIETYFKPISKERAYLWMRGMGYEIAETSSNSIQINESDRPDWFVYENRILSFRKDLGDADTESIQGIDNLAQAIYECKSRAMPVDYILDSKGIKWYLEEYTTREIGVTKVRKTFDISQGGVYDKTDLCLVESSVEIFMTLVGMEAPNWKNIVDIRGVLRSPMEGSHPEFQIENYYKRAEMV